MTSPTTLSDDLAQLCGERRLRIQKLEEALRPFAGWNDRDDSDARLLIQFSGLTLTVGDVRRARTALNGEKK